MNVALKAELQALLERTLAQYPSARSAVLQVERPGFLWSGAAGTADPDRGTPMRPDTPFRSATVGKMILAAALMTFVEDGVVALDEPAARFLGDEWPSGLSVIDGTSYGETITVRQLINHTSGLADYLSDGAGEDGQPPFVLEMMQQPDKLWDPREIIAWTVENLPPHFPPGAGWSYNDTGFLLAGLIVEAAAGKPLHEVYRERLFEPLEMAHTYMVFREPPRVHNPPETYAYVGDLVYSAPRTVSADWAGGGLVTTANDLTSFLSAMVEDRVFRHRGTREQMMAWTPTGEPGVYYGLGVRRLALDELGTGYDGELWGHTGALNVSMFYYPPLDMTIVGSLSQSDVPGVWSSVRPVSVLVPEVLSIMTGADRGD